MKTNNNFKVCNYSNTIRLMPQNYWIATIKGNGLAFDSWDGMTKQLFKERVITKKEVIKFYNKVKNGGDEVMSI